MSEKRRKTEEGEGEEEEEEGLSDETLKWVKDLDDIQVEIEKINDQASEKVLEIECEFNKQRRPFFDKRNEAIAHIPEFWLTTFLNYPPTQGLISDEDQAVLKFLQTIDVQDFEDVKSGYRIVFKFASNPFFENEELAKEFHYSPEGVCKVTSSIIHWKPGKNVCAPPADSKGSKRTAPDVVSFFTWFDPEDQEQELGEVIKERMWPNPLEIFSSGGDEDALAEDDEDYEEEGDEGEEYAEDDEGDDNA